MGSTRRRRGVGRPARVALAALALVGAGCSSGSDEGSADPDPNERTTTEPAGGARPEGRWTLVLTTTSRSDAPDLDPGVAAVRLLELTPTCDEGPCDLDVSPDGADGTYLPEGVATQDAPNTDPAVFTWDGEAATYTRITEPRPSSCTNVDGERLEDAYAVSTTTTLTYHPAEDERPAGLAGTWVTTVAETPEGLAAGCSPYEERGFAVGTPTGSLAGDAAPDLTGTYVTTEVVTRIEPSDQRPPGFTGLLGPFELTASGRGYTATGVIGDAELEPDGDGYSGSTSTIERPCTTTPEGPETPAAYTSTEELDGLAPIALTEDGAPILAGGWRLAEEATPAGTAAGCPSVSNAGYVVLVPAAALG